MHFINIQLILITKFLFFVARLPWLPNSLEYLYYFYFIFQLYMYQLFRSLAYIHSLGICHRDIKPQNLLLDPETGVLKLCDFGSAKHLVKGEPNVSYICSRYYRAPELIFGAIDYTTKIGQSLQNFLPLLFFTYFFFFFLIISFFLLFVPLHLFYFPFNFISLYLISLYFILFYFISFCFSII